MTQARTAAAAAAAGAAAAAAAAAAADQPAGAALSGFDDVPDILEVNWVKPAEKALLAARPVTAVQLDAAVVLKIIKHCRDNHPAASTGQLLGADVTGTLEVTNCFPYTARPATGIGASATAAAGADELEADAAAALAAGVDDTDADGADYQLQMLRGLRALNFDANTVGWYQSTHMGSFFNQTLIDTQYSYQKSFAQSVVLVYDPARSAQGNLSIQALRLTDRFMEVYESGKFSMENILKHKLTPASVFEIIPVRIHNSYLLTAMLHDMNARATVPPAALLRSFPPSFLPAHLASNAATTPLLTPTFDSLESISEAYLEKHIELLGEAIENHGQEQWRWQGWQRSMQKEHGRFQQHIAALKAENAAAIAAGDPAPHSEADLKACPTSYTRVLDSEPSRLESLVLSNQIDTYCKQIHQFSGPSLTKMFVAKGVQEQ